MDHVFPQRPEGLGQERLLPPSGPADPRVRRGVRPVPCASFGTTRRASPAARIRQQDLTPSKDGAVGPGIPPRPGRPSLPWRPDGRRVPRAPGGRRGAGEARSAGAGGPTPAPGPRGKCRIGTGGRGTPPGPARPTGRGSGPRLRPGSPPPSDGRDHEGRPASTLSLHLLLSAFTSDTTGAWSDPRRVGRSARWARRPNRSGTSGSPGTARRIRAFVVSMPGFWIPALTPHERIGAQRMEQS